MTNHTGTWPAIWHETGACGTRKGYQRHGRWGEERCIPCREANRLYNLALRQRHGHQPILANKPAEILHERLNELLREYGGMQPLAQAYTAAHGGKPESVVRFIHRIMKGQRFVWESTYDKWVVL